MVFHTAVSKFKIAYDQLEPMVRQGISVVSSCEELLFPALREPRLAAKLDTRGVEVEGDIALRLQRPREIRRAAAVTATDFQHRLSAEGSLGRHVMIQLNADAIRFVLGSKRDGHRRFLLVTVVQ